MKKSKCAVMIGIGLVLAAAILAGGAFGQAKKTAAAPNLLVNGSFELLDNAAPQAWRSVNWEARAEFASDDAYARSGLRSVRISSTIGADAFWQAVVPVRPYAKYRLSGWIKTKDLVPGGGQGALLNLDGLDVGTPAVSGTRDWTRVEVAFDTGANDAVAVNCLFGGDGRATGTAWFDDLQLILLSAKTLRPKATIETGASRPPISRYIYGQFIEHLGRCIYGGIWSEMLEDRKFYHPVGGKESPWKTVGEARNVRMNPVLIYAGVPAPEIRMMGDGTPGGIVQDDLAVVAGKSYVGRIVLAGDPEAVPVEVSLVWGPGADDRRTLAFRDVRADYKTFPLAFTAEGSSDKARLEIVSRGRESFRVAAASLMPADNVEGFRPDVLDLLKKLNAPVYRWPGGNFVSGYDWKDGLGDPDRRPPRKNPAWLGIEPNDVGIHEFLRFCELIGTDPYITVNSGQGNETMAADEVEYVNGPADSVGGARRAANGHPAPWKARLWSIGNEMYGNWQLGHMPLADYTLKHNRFANAMWVKDPSIRLVGVGAAGAWSRTMLAECAPSLDYLSEHFYVQSRPGLLSHVGQMPREIKRIADAHRAYRKSIPALKDKTIPVALDEWNYWYGPHVYGELGTQYFLKDALGVAAGLHEYFRNSDVFFMANYAQTVNVIGALKTSKTASALDTTGVVLELYRNHYGTIPVRVTGAPEPLDVAAAWKDARKRVLTVAVVNPTKTAQTLPLTLKGAKLPKTVKKFIVTGKDEMACNVPGREPGVKAIELNGVEMGKNLNLLPMSVTLYEITVR
ncbi:MAG: alpha-L-arabinofuranosidase C-terminal domain-containing protein [Acidobacteriota bacterium]|nr:alpha-L-arabinofuranosidase C-terminal domain-containing protein [Acidobacteriota bacterium]